MSSFSKNIIFGALIAVLLSTTIVLGLLWMQTKKEVRSKNQEVSELQKQLQELQTKLTEQKPQLPDTSGWKTYRNEKYGFEVKRPASWVFTVKPLAGGRGLSEYISVQIPPYSGDSITIEMYTAITKEEALHKAGFQTRAEAELGEFAGGIIPDGNYFTRGSAAGPAVPAEEVQINGYQALTAYIPVRFYDKPAGSYSGTGEGKTVLLFGKNVYAHITVLRLTEEFDQFLSAFKFIK